MANPYQVLGVSPLAGPEEIKSAFRRLAKKYHPDAGTNDPAHHERFHEVTAAYDLLRRKAKAGDNKRSKPSRTKAKPEPKKADRDTQRPRPSAKPQAEKFKPETTSAGSNAGHDASPDEQAADTPTNDEKKHPPFSEFLTNLKNVGKRAFRPTGLDHSYELSIPFLDAVSGTKRQLTLQNNKALEVHVPAGVEDGQQIRLRGQGGSGIAAGDAGDAMVTISIAPHPVFRREGADIHTDVCVSLPEAVLGAKINVPTVDGEVAVTVPPGSNSGSILRLKGKGLAYSPGKRRLGRGDHYVTLSLTLPPKPDDALKDFVATWAAGLKHSPRKS
jgi:DnaJ-class molecular chaperone